MNSTTWKNWITQMDFKSCLPCRKNHGKIYEAGKPMFPAPPAHPNCRCQILPLSAILAGTATKKGLSGADWYLSHFGFLPDYYISLENANQMGYDPKKNFLSSVIPDKTLFKTDICQKSLEESGTKLTSITPEASVERTEFFFQTTD